MFGFFRKRVAPPPSRGNASPYNTSRPARLLRGSDSVYRYAYAPSIVPEDIAGAGRAIRGHFLRVESAVAYNSAYSGIGNPVAGLAYGQLDRPMLVDPTYLTK